VYGYFYPVPKLRTAEGSPYTITSPLFKQSTGLFENSPLAERLNATQGFALHPPETLSLDSAKGFHPLESHFIYSLSTIRKDGKFRPFDFIIQ
jgi:hypothetical protein